MAPGRVNLMGDHTDYNGGLALPMAIQLGTRVGFRSSGHAQLHVRTSADAVALTLDVGARSPAAPMGPALPHWGRLTAAVARHARTTEGGELEIEGTVPSGAGLSSSASLCVALSLALGEPGEPLALARLCQRAEAEAGADVGLLDPLVIAAAEPGTAMLIDFADLSFSFVPIPMGVEFLIVDSGARRTLADSPYRQRRSECERAVRASVGRTRTTSPQSPIRCSPDGPGT